MTTRRYDQCCPLAMALDVIGDRWALLVVRELLIGPRRFGELLEGLPGISTDVLSTRLRELEEAGVLARGASPNRRYDLTSDGWALRRAVFELARWGARRLGSAPPEDVPAHRTMAALSLRTESVRLRGADGLYEIHADGEVFGLAVTDGHIVVTDGAAEDPPAAVLVIGTESLFALANGTPLSVLTAEGAAEVAGDQRAMERLLTTLSYSGVFVESPAFGAVAAN